MTDQISTRAKTGVPGLDQVLRGGLPENHLYLVNGPSGAGKTTLVLQFLMQGAAEGARSLYVGTSETQQEIQLVSRSHGWDLSGVELRHHAGAGASTRVAEQTMLHPAEVELPRAMEQLVAMVAEIRPRRLVIDSLSEIRILSREDNWFREQIMILQRIAAEGCTVLVTDIFFDQHSPLRSGVHGILELDQRVSQYGPDRRRIRIVKMRGIRHGTGFHDFIIEKGGLKVFPRLVAAEQRRSKQPQLISSGLAELDSLLGGGVDAGTATLLLGPTGTGKSTLATQFVVAAARRGEKSAMYVFDERLQTLFKRAAGVGLELEEHVKSGLVSVRQVDPVELTPGQFSQAVVDSAESGAQMIVIDSLNGYSYAMPEEGLLGLHLHELSSYLSERGVTSLQVMTQHGLLAPQATGFDVSYIADTVIVLRPFEHAGAVRRAISVHKRRGGSHERTIREFDMREGQVVVGMPLTEFSGVLSNQLSYLGGSHTRPGVESDQ